MGLSRYGGDDRNQLVSVNPCFGFWHSSHNWEVVEMKLHTDALCKS